MDHRHTKNTLFNGLDPRTQSYGIFRGKKYFQFKSLNFLLTILQISENIK